MSYRILAMLMPLLAAVEAIAQEPSSPDPAGVGDRRSGVAIKTNLLYDALLVPNVGAEFQIAGVWSVGVDWMYAWWKNGSGSFCWRSYGGGLAVRRYLNSGQSSFGGHHIGVFGQVFTCDFAIGGHGFIAGRPGGGLFDGANYAAGVEYGYSLPLGRVLSIDFAVGVGYAGGRYYEYDVADGCNVWRSTKRRHWFGPAKAEVSLVWHIGGSKGGGDSR